MLKNEEAGNIVVGMGLGRFVKEIVPRSETIIQPDWDRKAELNRILDIKSGEFCKRCGCLSCNRTQGARNACASSAGGAAN